MIEKRSPLFIVEASSENWPDKNSFVLTLGFSIPQAKVSPADGSASITKTFLPYSLAATAIQ